VNHAPIGEPHNPDHAAVVTQLRPLASKYDLSHIAATPVGMRVRATAEVVRVEGRTIHFRVRAEDERELIGEGTHERVVVNVNRFDQRVQAKLRAP